jgi:hypothetical protein
VTSTADRTADAVAAAVLGCRAVARLHGGPFGTTTTYLPGRRLAGVTLTPEGVTVGVVGRYPATVAEIAAQVREAVAALLPGTAITVAVEDIDLDSGEHGGTPRPQISEGVQLT